MRGQSLMEGERLYLKCEASGNPSPSFRWYKDGRELQRGKDVKIKTNRKNSKVQINRARLEDSGNYTCVVENMLGQESTTSSISVQSLTTTLSPGSSHARRCNDTEKSYCVNGGDCYFIHGINQLSFPSSVTHIQCQAKAEELYQRRVLTITGICVALLVVGMVCVVAYCKTKKQRKKIHGHLNQNVNQNQCVEQPNRMLANGPNHPGPGPEEIPMVDYISKNAPTTECSIIQHGPEEAVNYAESRMSTRSHHSSTVSHNSRHEERTWSIERTDSMNSDCQSGALSSSVGTSKCSSPTCMEARARRAAYWGCSEGASLQYGDSYDSLRDSPHSDRYVSALTTPARLSPIEFHYPPLPPQVPTFQITSPNTGHALALPPAAAAYQRDDDQPLLRCPQVTMTLPLHSLDGRLYRQPRRPRQPYLTESTGSLPSSPYHLPDDEAYETTQEYASSREPIRSRRRPRRNRLNGHVSQRAMGQRDNSSQSFSQSEEEEEEEEGQGESTPFLSMQNMNMEPCERGYRSSTAPAPTADIRTHRAQGRPSTRSNGHSKSSQSRSSKNDNAPL
uniref:Neuregulin 2b n=1 Tax=Hucho hucho TaxID=62062 RepID=A0A4W5L6R7_9TELE